MSRLTAEQLDTKLREIHSKGNSYYLVAQHNRDLEISLIHQVEQRLYSQMGDIATLLAVGHDEDKYSLPEIDEDFFQMLQDVDSLHVPFTIKVQVFDTTFLINKVETMTLQELKSKASLFGPKAKFNIVIGTITHGGPSADLELEGVINGIYEDNE